jgi:hypothetical protein
MASGWNIEYLGRVDMQVKIRGYRIELEKLKLYFSSLIWLTRQWCLQEKTRKAANASSAILCRKGLH